MLHRMHKKRDFLLNWNAKLQIRCFTTIYCQKEEAKPMKSTSVRGRNMSRFSSLFHFFRGCGTASLFLYLCLTLCNPFSAFFYISHAAFFLIQINQTIKFTVNVFSSHACSCTFQSKSPTKQGFNGLFYTFYMFSLSKHVQLYGAPNCS